MPAGGSTWQTNPNAPCVPAAVPGSVCPSSVGARYVCSPHTRSAYTSQGCVPQN